MGTIKETGKRPYFASMDINDVMPDNVVCLWHQVMPKVTEKVFPRIDVWAGVDKKALEDHYTGVIMFKEKQIGFHEYMLIRRILRVDHGLPNALPDKFYQDGREKVYHFTRFNGKKLAELYLNPKTPMGINVGKPAYFRHIVNMNTP